MFTGYTIHFYTADEQPMKMMQAETAYAEDFIAENNIEFQEDTTQTIIHDTNKSIETYIATMDMSHYTNEIGSHVPTYEGGAKDRRGNLLVAYESIAIPKKLYSQLPYGSKVKLVYPNGEVCYGRAVDTGGALNKLNRIDRCVATYREASNLGVIKNVQIYRIDD